MTKNVCVQPCVLKHTKLCVFLLFFCYFFFLCVYESSEKVWIKPLRSVCVCVYDKLVQFQARRADICLIGVVVSSFLLLHVSVPPRFKSALGGVCSDSTETITVQPPPLAGCCIGPLIRPLMGAVDQLRSLYRDPCTAATAPWADMINKSRGNNTVISH